MPEFQIKATAATVDSDQEKYGEDLCKSCGMCCEGVFHSHVILTTEEDIDLANRIGVTIIDSSPNDGLAHFSLPCPAFAGTCSAYPERPSTCASHKCSLLRNTLADNISLAEAKQRVKEVRQLTGALIPKLQDLADTKSSNRPEWLMKKATENLQNENSRKDFERTNREAIFSYVAFVNLRKRHFYPD